MVRVAGNLKAKGQIKTIKVGDLSAGTLSAGKLTAGKLTAGNLKPEHLMNATRKLIHPDVMQKLQGAGFFDKFTDILNTANKVVSGVSQAVDIGKKAYDVGKNIYGTYKSLRGGKMPVLRRKSAYNRMSANEELSEDEGGKLVAGRMSAGSLKSEKKSKRKLPEALRQRAVALGKLMKQGYDMKTASEMYKKNKK